MKIGILGMLILAGIGFYSCDDITKGYLETGEAGYVTDTLRIALAPDSRDSIPYQSEKIQGVIGTFPIYYELAACRDRLAGRGGIDRGVPDREGSYDPSGHIQGRPPGVEPGT